MTTNVGKAMRLKRVIDPDGVSVICALDHGMTSPTFLEPLADIEARTREAVAGGANVIMMSKGMIRVAQEAFAPTTSLALLLSASAGPGGDRPEIVQIADVEEALILGADAVVLFTALGGDTEAGMVDILSTVGRECAALGSPGGPDSTMRSCSTGWNRPWKRGRSGAPSGGTSSCTPGPRRSPGRSRGSSVNDGRPRRPCRP